MSKKLFFVLVFWGLSFCICANATEPETMQCSCTCQRSSVVEEAVVPLAEPTITYNPHDLVISEVYPSPNTGEREWVELYNATAGTIDLTNWTMLEGGGSTTNLTGEISPGEYLVFYKSSLNNAGDLITLKDATAQVIDEVSYGDWDDGFSADNASAPRKGESIIRLDLENSYDIDFQDYDITLEPTMAMVNVYTPPFEEIEDEAPEPVEEVLPELTEVVEALPTTLKITEIFPNPTDSDAGAEWIELYNYGDADVNLNGWKLDDIDGGSSPHVFSENLIVRPGNYYLASNESTKISLNNDADEARLFDPSGNLVDSIVYDGCQENFSYAEKLDIWSWTDQFTPGVDNVVAVDDNVGTLTAAPYRLAATALAATPVSTKNKTTTIRKKAIEQVMSGNIIALPGVVSAKTVYLDNGLEIYSASSEWPSLALGDYLSARGKLSTDGRRLTVDSLEGLEVDPDQFREVEVAPLKAEELSVEYIGRLVSLEGEIVAKKSNVISLADDTGEFALYRYTQNKAINFDYVVGDRIRVVGLLRDFSGQLRIVPRTTADLQIISVPGESSPSSAPVNSAGSGVWVFWVVFLLVSAAIVYKKRLEISNFRRVIIGVVRSRWNDFRKPHSC